MALSNIFLEKILKHCSSFVGVYSCNNIPPELTNRDKFSIICNLSPVSSIGSHFISIITFPTYVLYIDSFGVPSISHEISQFLLKIDKPIFYNMKQLQDQKSDFCGYYAAMFVIYFDRKHVVNIKTLSFTSNFKENDYNTVLYVKKYVEINQIVL
jgi:hypothetical protein